MSKEQYKGIHDVCSALQGDFKHEQPFGSCRRKRINPAKQKDALTSFLMLGVEAKIFQYCFLEEHKVCVNHCY